MSQSSCLLRVDKKQFIFVSDAIVAKEIIQDLEANHDDINIEERSYAQSYIVGNNPVI